MLAMKMTAGRGRSAALPASGHELHSAWLCAWSTKLARRSTAERSRTGQVGTAWLNRPVCMSAQPQIQWTRSPTTARWRTLLTRRAARRRRRLEGSLPPRSWSRRPSTGRPPGTWPCSWCAPARVVPMVCTLQRERGVCQKAETEAHPPHSSCAIGCRTLQPATWDSARGARPTDGMTGGPCSVEAAAETPLHHSCDSWSW